ncbi:MAG: amino acid aminotransferase [Paracoccaceae bacterium]
MFEKLKPQPEDKIIKLIGMYAADPRATKVDLGVGVYKDASGNTPVMRAVKKAETMLLKAQSTKKYVGLLGNLDYVAAMQDLVLSDSVDMTRVTGAQTPGGTGAIRQIFELIQMANPDATVWISDPSWPNHAAILNYLGIKIAKYRYFDEATCGVDFDGMLVDLGRVVEGDVVLLHGCCHNPTGANITLAQWDKVADLVLAKKVMPMIDIAYQGFGDGLDEDAAGVRLMAAKVPEMLIAASCSKNFGLYRDRVGVALALCQGDVTLTKGAFAALNRMNFSFPPDHGATVVAMIMADPALKADWLAELEEMRASMLSLRTGLAKALRRETNSDRFDFVESHRGMFSRLGLTPDQVEKLRADYGIYMVGDSRFNVAGLPAEGLDDLAKAIAAVL